LAESPFAKLDALRAACGLVDDEIPNDAFTLKFYADHCGVGRQTADSQLRQFVATGAMRTGKKRVMRGTRMGMVNFYWLAGDNHAKP